MIKVTIENIGQNIIRMRSTVMIMAKLGYRASLLGTKVLEKQHWLSLLTQTMPGWSFGSYNGFGIDGDSDHARLMPFSSTFVGWTLYEQRIKDGDKPHKINVKVSDGQLEIIATFGKKGSVGDYLLLANPKFSEK